MCRTSEYFHHIYLTSLCNKNNMLSFSHNKWEYKYNMAEREKEPFSSFLYANRMTKSTTLAFFETGSVL